MAVGRLQPTSVERTKNYRTMLDIRKVIRSTCKGAVYVAGAVIFAQVLLISLDVAGRYLFNSPIKGTIEVIGLSLVVVVFFGLGRNQYLGENVRVDILLTRFPPQTQRILEASFRFVGVVVFSLLAWRSIMRALADWHSGLYSDLLKIPIYFFKIILAIGCFLLVLELLIEFIDFLTAKKEA